MNIETWRWFKMNIETWLGLLKATKRTEHMTGYLHVQSKIDRNAPNAITLIPHRKPRQGQNWVHLKVWFKSPEPKLTVFEAELLYFVLVQQKRPADYASYHTCIAGQRFISSIDSYAVVDSINCA